jgi:hypothetical protein
MVDLLSLKPLTLLYADTAQDVTFFFPVKYLNKKREHSTRNTPSVFYLKMLKKSIKLSQIKHFTVLR